MVGQGQTQERAGRRAAESLLRFWADAGVDAQYLDEPVNRLEAPQRPRPGVAAPAAPPVVGMGIAGTAPADVSAVVAEARTLAAACSNLEALADAIAAFEGCALKSQGARRSVFCRGDPQASVVVVGEGPGADEDRLGQPFVGVAGQLLDKMLAAAGLAERVFITNTVFWRPPGNRDPTPAEQAVCRPFLEQAIRLVRPKVLLLVGAPSAKSLLGRAEGILSLRGRWFEWSDEEQTLSLPALPTLHPAFLLRQPAQKKKAWSDLLTLAERVDRPERAP